MDLARSYPYFSEEREREVRASLTPLQDSVFDSNGPLPYIARSIIMSLKENENVNPSGIKTYDLEDVCCTTKFGKNAVDEAKYRAESNDYKDYRNFLPKEETEFVDTWLSLIRLE
jgi:hypothetical protein